LVVDRTEVDVERVHLDYLVVVQRTQLLLVFEFQVFVALLGEMFVGEVEALEFGATLESLLRLDLRHFHGDFLEVLQTEVGEVGIFELLEEWHGLVFVELLRLE